MTNEKLNTALYEKIFAEQETYRACSRSATINEPIAKGSSLWHNGVAAKADYFLGTRILRYQIFFEPQQLSS